MRTSRYAWSIERWNEGGEGDRRWGLGAMGSEAAGADAATGDSGAEWLMGGARLLKSTLLVDSVLWVGGVSVSIGEPSGSGGWSADSSQSSRFCFPIQR